MDYARPGGRSVALAVMTIVRRSGEHFGSSYTVAGTGRHGRQRAYFGAYHYVARLNGNGLSSSAVTVQTWPVAEFGRALDHAEYLRQFLEAVLRQCATIYNRRLRLLRHWMEMSYRWSSRQGSSPLLKDSKSL